VKPAPFRYHRPQSLGQALDLLSQYSDAKVIAGGQSLGPMLNMRLAQPAELIDLNGLAGLDSIDEVEGFIRIGALARHHAVASSAVVRKHCPLLAEAAQAIGHYAIRCRGTIGGSLAHADPAAQLPLVAATLGAEIDVAGKRGGRRIAAANFFVSLMTTALEPDEILVSVTFPKLAAGEAHCYLQFSRRRGDFAIVGVAATLLRDARGAVKRLRLGLGGAESTPVVLDELAARASGQMPDRDWAMALAAAAREAVQPAEDPRVPAVYRRELVEVLVRRALFELCQ
jgi:carbon-monoxide dehydrogenase medium subunit